MQGHAPPICPRKQIYGPKVSAPARYLCTKSPISDLTSYGADVGSFVGKNDAHPQIRHRFADMGIFKEKAIHLCRARGYPGGLLVPTFGVRGATKLGFLHIFSKMSFSMDIVNFKGLFTRKSHQDTPFLKKRVSVVQVCTLTGLIFLPQI